MYCTKQEALKIAKAYWRERGCTLKKVDDRFAACNKKNQRACICLFNNTNGARFGLQQ